MARNDTTEGRSGGLAVLAAVGILLVPALAASAATDTPLYLETETIDPVTPKEGDSAGMDVAVHGDVLVVGVPGDDKVARDAGAVHVFERSPTGYAPVQTLAPPGLPSTSAFGSAVAFDGDTLVVGAPGFDVEQDGDKQRFGVGVAHVYSYDGSSFEHERVLASDEPRSLEVFGSDVDVAGDRIAVGVPGEVSLQHGAVEVYERQGSSWVHETQLQAPAEDSGAVGTSVAVGDGLVLGGSPGAAVNGTPLVGQIHVFVESADDSWERVDELTPPGDVNAENDFPLVRMFAKTIDVEDGRLFVGAPGPQFERIPDPPLDQPPPGHVYVFERDGASFAFDEELTPVGALYMDQFGTSVDASDDRVLVGAPETIWDREIGAGYVFEETDQDRWVQLARLTPSQADTFDFAGSAVGFDGSTALLGAYGHNGAASDTGAVFAFEAVTANEPLPAPS